MVLIRYKQIALQPRFVTHFLQVVSECLASVLLNSSNLMRIDLEGANLLAPYVVTTLKIVLPEKER